MKIRRTIPIVSAALALTFAVPLTATQDDVIVNFGDPVTLAGAGNQVVVPDEVTIGKGGTVTFVVNGPGHGIAIYPISDKTTRDDITAQLCAHDQVTGACIDPTFANADHTTLDGKNNVIIVTGTNPPFQRVDDPTDRLLATSTQIGDLPGVFLTGTSSTTSVTTQLQFRFTKTGRYLVVCMNRNHYLNNWMFGFVTVGG
jgi:plastocyanin